MAVKLSVNYANDKRAEAHKMKLDEVRTGNCGHVV